MCLTTVFIIFEFQIITGVGTSDPNVTDKQYRCHLHRMALRLQREAPCAKIPTKV